MFLRLQTFLQSSFSPFICCHPTWPFLSLLFLLFMTHLLFVPLPWLSHRFSIYNNFISKEYGGVFASISTIMIDLWVLSAIAHRLLKLIQELSRIIFAYNLAIVCARSHTHSHAHTHIIHGHSEKGFAHFSEKLWWKMQIKYT